MDRVFYYDVTIDNRNKMEVLSHFIFRCLKSFYVRYIRVGKGMMELKSQ